MNVLFLLIPRPARSTLFPYTTLFRSQRVLALLEVGEDAADQLPETGGVVGLLRSEEHTSELQSRVDLVCRLLLEKKKAAARAARPRTSSGRPASLNARAAAAL